MLGGAWLLFQIYILAYPLEPLIAHPLHLVFALGLALLWTPLGASGGRFIDAALLSAVAAVGVYYLMSAGR